MLWVSVQAADKGNLIAIGELGTAVAFVPDLVRQLRLIDPLETDLLKETGLIGEAENSRNA